MKMKSIQDSSSSLLPLIKLRTGQTMSLGASSVTIQ